MQSVMHGQSLRGRGFQCRPTHRRRQPKPAGGTCSSRGAANVLARKPCSEPRPHSCAACLVGSLRCVHHGREWKTSVGHPSEISIDARARWVPHLFPATMRLQSILGLGGACKLETYQADRSLNPPPLSRHSSNPRGHATASGARIPYGKASVASQNLVYSSAQVAQGGCSRSNSRLTGTPSPVGAGGVRSSSRHPAGRSTTPWKLVL